MARFRLFDGVDGEKTNGVDDARGGRCHVDLAPVGKEERN
jgi:hypothetical protein